jgi:hypothetical protein
LDFFVFKEDAVEKVTTSKVGVKPLKKPEALQDRATDYDRVYSANTPSSTTSVCNEEGEYSFTFLISMH